MGIMGGRTGEGGLRSCAGSGGCVPAGFGGIWSCMTAWLGELWGSVPACMSTCFGGFGAVMDQGDRMIVVDSVGPERELKLRPARRRYKLKRVKKLVGVASEGGE